MTSEDEGSLLVRRVVPLYLHSIANVASHEHWGKRKRHAEDQNAVIDAVMKLCGFAPPILPVRIVLVRVAPRTLDSDNLVNCTKHVRDSIARWLGVNDRDPRLAWQIGARKGYPKAYAVIIEVHLIDYVERPLLVLRADELPPIQADEREFVPSPRGQR